MARQRKGTGKSGPAPAKAKPEKTGTINRSQAVSTFGVGAVYELRRYAKGGGSLHSVMVAGLDFWDENNLRRLRERELEKALDVDCFRLPPTEEQFESSGGMCCVPAVRFPRWLVCEKCHRLGKVPGQFEDFGNQGPRCKAADCKARGFPSRLVTACYNPDPEAEDTQPGHIDDFPWDRWLFQDGSACDNPQLKLESTGSTAGLSGLVVSCVCETHRGNLRRSLAGVFGNGVMDRVAKCWGCRPWLDDSDPDGCKHKVRAMLRGASNVYFPVTASAISIPPYSESLFQIIQTQGDALLRSGLPQADIISGLRNAIPDLQRRHNEDDTGDLVYSDQQIAEAIGQFTGADSPAMKSQKEIRTRERRAILEGRPEDDGGRSEFVAEVTPQEELPPTLRDRFACAVKVHRLREVRALKGFCRVTPPLAGDPLRTRCAPLASKKTRWLPAIEVRGEGIYLEFDPARVRRWEKLDAVRGREEILRANTLRRLGGTEPDPDSGIELPTARLVLVHTLAHLLMKQFALDCGYSGASLRERLYVRPDADGGELGLLIYTATPGADGTNGGLVRQGRPERLAEVLLAALQGAAWCSSDPLCIEFRGQGTDALNLAACHSCCLVSETSCEYRNTLLDRGLVIGLPGRPEVGYFGDLVAGA